MIRDFKVRNFLSISDEQELNFIAKDSDSEVVTEVADGTFLYKLGILYGANASGKSNMLLALNEVFRILTIPKANANNKILGYFPFALTDTEPTGMYVSFYADDVRYDYSVKFDSKNIYNEELYYYPHKSKALFYERTYVDDNVQANIKFGPSLHFQMKTQESIRENTLNNHSVLSVCLKNTFKEDIEPFSRLHGYLLKNYHDVDNDANNKVISILKEAYEDNRKHKFFSQMLAKADLNIDDFRLLVQDRSIPENFRERIEKENLPQSIKDEILRPTAETLVFSNHSQKGTFDIPLELQSKATVKYIRILKTLYNLISGKHVYFLDELGEDLHYDLLFYYLNVFLFNSNQSQLLITSQETALLSQDLINENRGLVWFVEKNHDTASSEYNRGDSFGLHKNLSLYNSYRIGRLGAKPDLGSIFLDLEDS